MISENFTLMQFSVGSILGMIEAKQFVIPEIQRPFVWRRTQVRDLIDSLYCGYPTGYIITWKNPDVHTKDGSIANGNHVLIDGQQRITAIMSAIAGLEVLDSNFNKDRIRIAFNPFAEDKSKRFAVQDASHLRDKKWIPDISVVFDNDFDSYEFAEKYCEDNSGITPKDITRELTKLKGIANRQIGVIQLDHSLDIDEVTEIFIRINSRGTALSQSDFVMSKMAADTEHGGNTLRKVVDYFCHMAVKPDFYPQMLKDTEFSNTEYSSKIKWLSSDYEDIYNPDYNDVLRVSFMYSFDRARLSELVSLLSGRDFETREFKEEIIEESYKKLEDGLREFIREYNFNQFILAIKGAGYQSSKLLNSQMTLDFAYMLYLKLSKDSSIPNDQVKHYVQKWFVLTTLTGRYVASPESAMARDIRMINEKGFVEYAKEVEASVLSDTFWNVTLPQNLSTNSTNSPSFKTFLAAQINMNCNSLLMHGTMISDLLIHSGDVHHIFPRAYLKSHGVTSKGVYNQVANYTILDTQVNKAISDDAPNVYFGKVVEQCKNGDIAFGNISSLDSLKQNLEENAIPENVVDMTVENYEDFLQERRILMAKLVEKYYKNL